MIVDVALSGRAERSLGLDGAHQLSISTTRQRPAKAFGKAGHLGDQPASAVSLDSLTRLSAAAAKVKAYAT
ncbi:hypothetical protein ACKWRH_06085 [Bradyrhizobium sp. Pa8]|uniref:hypothetical protein n=1 Tax=Bradyrhizobium sp. Pa8 TaxID=3386552 RepID=UPI00403F0AD9